MNITIQTIPHSDQDYATAGNWKIDESGQIKVLVSETGNWRYNALIAVHELIEALVCYERGITQYTVDEFDIAFEAKRPAGSEDEPGDEPDSPYENEHSIATGVERILAAALVVKWKLYEEKINALFPSPTYNSGPSYRIDPTPPESGDILELGAGGLLKYKKGY